MNAPTNEQPNEQEIKKLKIGIVDDSSFSRKTMIDILEEDGHTIVGEANNADMALQIIQTSDIDLFIIDVVMPEVSGLELLKAIKESKKKDLAIIMVSSLNIENVIIDAISGGAHDYISKPFEKKDLISSVNKIAYNLANDK